MQSSEKKDNQESPVEKEADLSRRDLLKKAGWTVPAIASMSLVNTASAMSCNHDGGHHGGGGHGGGHNGDGHGGGQNGGGHGGEGHKGGGHGGGHNGGGHQGGARGGRRH